MVDAYRHNGDGFSSKIEEFQRDLPAIRGDVYDGADIPGNKAIFFQIGCQSDLFKFVDLSLG
jgi:hypothetical protein